MSIIAGNNYYPNATKVVTFVPGEFGFGGSTANIGPKDSIKIIVGGQNWNQHKENWEQFQRPTSNGYDDWYQNGIFQWTAPSHPNEVLYYYKFCTIMQWMNPSGSSLGNPLINDSILGGFLGNDAGTPYGSIDGENYVIANVPSLMIYSPYSYFCNGTFNFTVRDTYSHEDIANVIHGEVVPVGGGFTLNINLIPSTDSPTIKLNGTNIPYTFSGGYSYRTQYPYTRYTASCLKWCHNASYEPPISGKLSFSDGSTHVSIICDTPNCGCTVIGNTLYYVMLLGLVHNGGTNPKAGLMDDKYIANGGFSTYATHAVQTSGSVLVNSLVGPVTTATYTDLAKDQLDQSTNIGKFTSPTWFGLPTTTQLSTPTILADISFPNGDNPYLYLAISRNKSYFSSQGAFYSRYHATTPGGANGDYWHVAANATAAIRPGDNFMYANGHNALIYRQGDYIPLTLISNNMNLLDLSSTTISTPVNLSAWALTWESVGYSGYTVVSKAGYVQYPSGNIVELAVGTVFVLTGVDFSYLPIGDRYYQIDGVQPYFVNFKGAFDAINSGGSEGPTTSHVPTAGDWFVISNADSTGLNNAVINGGGANAFNVYRTGDMIYYDGSKWNLYLCPNKYHTYAGECNWQLAQVNNSFFIQDLHLNQFTNYICDIPEVGNNVIPYGQFYTASNTGEVYGFGGSCLFGLGIPEFLYTEPTAITPNLDSTIFVYKEMEVINQGVNLSLYNNGLFSNPGIQINPKDRNGNSIYNEATNLTYLNTAQGGVYNIDTGIVQMGTSGPTFSGRWENGPGISNLESFVTCPSGVMIMNGYIGDGFSRSWQSELRFTDLSGKTAPQEITNGTIPTGGTWPITGRYKIWKGQKDGTDAIFAGLTGQNIYYSLDEGLTWQFDTSMQSGYVPKGNIVYSNGVACDGYNYSLSSFIYGNMPITLPKPTLSLPSGTFFVGTPNYVYPLLNQDEGVVRIIYGWQAGDAIPNTLPFYWEMLTCRVPLVEAVGSDWAHTALPAIPFDPSWNCQGFNLKNAVIIVIPIGAQTIACYKSVDNCATWTLLQWSIDSGKSWLTTPLPSPLP